MLRMASIQHISNRGVALGAGEPCWALRPPRSRFSDTLSGV
jgi:hypothetical protein